MTNSVRAPYQRENKCCERVNHATDYTTTSVLAWIHHEGQFSTKGNKIPGDGELG